MAYGCPVDNKFANYDPPDLRGEAEASKWQRVFELHWNQGTTLNRERA